MSVSLELKTNHKAFPIGSEGAASILASLRASEQPEEKEGDQPKQPVELVIVLDRSGSMAGSKLDLCKKTLEFLVEQGMREEDWLALVTFENGVRVDYAGGKMNADNKAELLRVVRGIKTGGCTNLSDGLFQGLSLLNKSSSLAGFMTQAANNISSIPDLVRRRFSATQSASSNFSGSTDETTEPAETNKPVNSISAVCLLTDGMMNRGITDVSQIIAEMDKRLERFPAGSRPSVFGFGYGQDADVNALTRIAESTQGSYYAINSPEAVPLAFADCLGGLQSVAAQNVQVVCELTAPATFSASMPIFTKYPVEKISDRKMKVTIKDMYCEEVRDLLFHVDLPVDDNREVNITVQTDYMDVLSERPVSDIKRISIGRTSGDSCEPTIPDAEVEKHVIRTRAAAALEDARKEGEQGRLSEAKGRLNSVMNIVKAKREQLGEDEEEDEMLTEMMNDLESAEQTLTSQSEFNLRGKAQMSSAMGYHCNQRMNKVDMLMEADDEGASSKYMTKAKKKMVSSSKSYFGYD